MTWYDESIAVIRQVVRDNPNVPEAELRRLVSKAYPFGPRQHWPYKAWCKAVNAILGPTLAQRNRQQRLLAEMRAGLGQLPLDEHGGSDAQARAEDS